MRDSSSVKYAEGGIIVAVIVGVVWVLGKLPLGACVVFRPRQTGQTIVTCARSGWVGPFTPFNPFSLLTTSLVEFSACT